MRTCRFVFVEVADNESVLDSLLCISFGFVSGGDYFPGCDLENSSQCIGPTEDIVRLWI